MVFIGYVLSGSDFLNQYTWGQLHALFRFCTEAEKAFNVEQMGEQISWLNTTSVGESVSKEGTVSGWPGPQQKANLNTAMAAAQVRLSDAFYGPGALCNLVLIKLAEGSRERGYFWNRRNRERYWWQGKEYTQ